MNSLSTVQRIDRPAEDVWELLLDFGNIGAWNPNLSGSRLLDGSPHEGVGTVRQCDMADGKNWIRERVVDWEPGRSYTVDIYEGTMPLAYAQATLGVRKTSSGSSEAYMEMKYRPKYGILGRAIDVMMMRSMLQRSMDNVVRGLGEAAEKAAA